MNETKYHISPQFLVDIGMFASQFKCNHFQFLCHTFLFQYVIIHQVNFNQSNIASSGYTKWSCILALSGFSFRFVMSFEIV